MIASKRGIMHCASSCSHRPGQATPQAASTAAARGQNACGAPEQCEQVKRSEVGGGARTTKPCLASPWAQGTPLGGGCHRCAQSARTYRGTYAHHGVPYANERLWAHQEGDAPWLAQTRTHTHTHEHTDRHNHVRVCTVAAVAAIRYTSDAPVAASMSTPQCIVLVFAPEHARRLKNKSAATATETAMEPRER